MGLHVGKYNTNSMDSMGGIFPKFIDPNNARLYVGSPQSPQFTIHVKCALFDPPKMEFLKTPILVNVWIVYSLEGMTRPPKPTQNTKPQEVWLDV